MSNRFKVDLEKLVELIRSNPDWTYKRLGEYFGVSKASIHSQLYRNNLKHLYTKKKDRSAKFENDLDISNLVIHAMKNNPELGLTELSLKLGLNVNHIYNIANRYRLDYKGKNKTTKVREDNLCHIKKQ